MAPILPGTRSRVARRIVGLFVFCALVPVTALAILTYRRVATALEGQAHARLGDETKASGLILVDRVTGIAAELESIANAVAPDGAASPHRGPVPKTRFRALALERADGSTESLIGEAGVLPALDAKQRARLEQGQTALLATSGPAGGRLYFVHLLRGANGTSMRLWGLAENDAVWGLTPDRIPAPPGMGFCLLTSVGESLSCPEAIRRRLDPAGLGPNGGTLGWQEQGTQFLTGYRRVFLGHDFGASPWIVALTLPESAVLAPLASFGRSFFLVVALALAVVFGLGQIHIRRSMNPLEQLTVATQRVAAGDFSHTALVASGDEFETLAISFNQMARDLQGQFTTLAKLHEIDRAALAVPTADAISAAVFAAAPVVVRSDCVTLAIAEPDDPTSWSITTRCHHSHGERRVRARPSQEELAELRDHAAGLRIPAGRPAPSYLGEACEPETGERVVLPLLTTRGVFGVLAFEHAAQLGGSAIGRARQLADQVTLAFSNAWHVGELEQLSWGALTALARTIDAVSPWTAGHSERVTHAALEIGRQLDLGADALHLIHRGGLLHDIGKIAVPAALLDKPGPLTPDEMEIVRSHPSVGARILAPIRAFREAIPLVLHHHEMLDGSGYPDGLRADEIPLVVRILTVADIYDALVSDRPYRSGWSSERALAFLEGGAGTKFDERVTTALGAALSNGWSPGQRSGGTEPVAQPIPAVAEGAVQ
jgi:putative nucleotidyltransferase with HDIG domain